jgi:LemA protein
MGFLIGIIIAIALAIGWGLLQYNSMVSLKNYIRVSWSDVDAELKRRYDLIPNLVSVVKGYAAHENSTLDRITALRDCCVASDGSPGEQAKNENQLVDALKQFHIVTENYPQLKADESFLKLQQELTDTENRIQAARRFYNGNVRDYRNKCEMFPSNLVAKALGFRSEGDFFSVPPSVRDVPNADFNLEDSLPARGSRIY